MKLFNIRLATKHDSLNTSRYIFIYFVYPFSSIHLKKKQIPINIHFLQFFLDYVVVFYSIHILILILLLSDTCCIDKTNKKFLLYNIEHIPILLNRQKLHTKKSKLLFENTHSDLYTQKKASKFVQKPIFCVLNVS